MWFTNGKHRAKRVRGLHGCLRTSELSLAATERGTSASAISHTIGNLQTRVGVRLFHRTKRNVSLTGAGRCSSDPFAVLRDGLAPVALCQLRWRTGCARLRMRYPHAFLHDLPAKTNVHAEAGSERVVIPAQAGIQFRYVVRSTQHIKM